MSASRFFPMSTSAFFGVEATQLENRSDGKPPVAGRGYPQLHESRRNSSWDATARRGMVRRTIGTRLEDLQFDERWLVLDLILSTEGDVAAA